MRLILIILVTCLSFQFTKVCGQIVAERVNNVELSRYVLNKDSVNELRKQAYTDSVMRNTWILDSSKINKNAFLDSVQKEFLFPVLDLWKWNKEFKAFKKKDTPYRTGKLLERGNASILGFVFGMLVLFAILRNAFYKQLDSIVQSFFSNRILNNINKEDNLFTSWPFLILFIQFGFVFGLFFFLVAQYYRMYQVQSGFKIFLIISAVIIALYALKLLVLRFLGLVFDMQKIVGEYISILYLSYFNASLLFLPLVVAFALSPLKYGPVYIIIALLILILVFTIQLLRAGVSILSNNKFSKIHLILYFCALEVCPILVLIKAIGLK